MNVHIGRSLSGSGMGGSSKTPKRTADNLFSNDVVEAILGISEGPIKGLRNGAKDFYIGDTPLQSVDGSDNFDAFELIVRQGTESGEEISSRLGGFGSSQNVNTELATSVTVVRQGLQNNIDYLDLRLVVNRLVKSNDKGDFEHTGKVLIEYKPSKTNTWTPIRTIAIQPLPQEIAGDNFKAFYSAGVTRTQYSTPGDRKVTWSNEVPTSYGTDRLWIQPNDQHRPRIAVGTQWVYPSNLRQEYSNNPAGDVTWSWTETLDWSAGANRIGKTTTLFVSSARPTSTVQGNLWASNQDGRVYMFNGSTWILAGSSITAVEANTAVEQNLANGELVIKGKTTSAFVKEIRFPVQRLKDDVYQLRVTKTTAINTTELFFDVTWESFQEVKAQSFRFPALATTQVVGRASDQFSSIPDFKGIYDGRIVRVPSNYDAITRTYTGLWDGTWKLSWTNNNAYILADLVENDRYGMNAYYPVTLNKWDVYEAGQWCDTRRADGKPRFTFNALLSDPRGGREAVDYIAGTFGARFFDDGNGFATIMIDRDDDPVALFAPENIEEGIFTYSFTDIEKRFNDITVTFINPELNWAEDRRRLFDKDHVERYGRIPLNFIAVGCTDADEALARARYKLFTGITETRIVNFKTNRAGTYIAPYNVVLIADDEMAGGLHGRIHETTSARRFTLREPMFLEPGYSYRAVFQVVDPVANDFKIVRIPITSTTGTIEAITLAEDLPALPEKAQFSIETTDGSAAPRAFRIVTIGEVEGDPDKVEISAVEYNRAKWAYVDGKIGSISDVVVRYDVKSGDKPDPIPALRVNGHIITVGRSEQHVINLDWDASPSKIVAKYQVSASRNDGPMQILGQTTELNFEWTNVAPGDYLFQVVAISLQGRESVPVFIGHRLIGDVTSIDAVKNLHLVGEPTTNSFESRSPRFEWDTITLPEHRNYVVQILDDIGATVRTIETFNSFYVYELQDNVDDRGGAAARTFTIQVASKDQYGEVSLFTNLTVTNPPPAPCVIKTLTQVHNSVVVDFTSQGERDVIGYLVHMSTDPGFTPGPANLVYQGINDSVSVGVEFGKTYYFYVAAFDIFGLTGLNYSDRYQIEVHVPTYTDFEAPDVPTGLALAIRLLDSGRSEVVVTWDANTEDDFAQYDLDLATDGGNFVTIPTNGRFYSFEVEPGTLVRARVRARDVSFNASEYCEIIELLAEVDSEPPATPANIKVRASFSAIWVRWDQNVEPDLAQYVVEVTSPVEQADGTFLPETQLSRANGTTFAQTGFKSGDDVIVRVGAEDRSGNISEMSAPIAVRIAGLDTTELDLELNDLIGDGAIDQTKIGMFAISTPKLRSNAVTTKKLRAESIEAHHMSTGEIITLSAQIADAIIDSAHIIELDAAKLRAGTALLGSLLVDGKTLTNIQQGATDPAARINGGSTRIDAGKVLISGGTTIADWRMGGDATRINGAMVSAGTIDANKLRIGLRNITLDGVTFEPNNPGINWVSWTGGSIRYINDAGVVTSTGLIPGNVPWGGGTIFIYWQKGTGYLQASTSAETAFFADCVILATYKGGVQLDANYGQTIIDGSMIKTGSVRAAQISVDNLQALNIKVQNIDIQEGTIGGEKLQLGAITEVYLDSSTGSIQPNATTNAVNRAISLGPYERLFVDATWNIRGVVNLTSEITFFGYARILVNGSVVAETVVVGPAIDRYTCSNQSISASYTHGAGAGVVTVTFQFVMGSGGVLRRANPNEGLITQAITNDGTYMSTMRGKR